MNDNAQTQMVVMDQYSILPLNLEAKIAEAIQMRDALNKLFKNLLELGKDFAQIPGTDKPTLLKPGAEMLCKVFKLAPGKCEVLDKDVDWEKNIFSYTIGMPLIHIDSGLMVAYGTGAANSREVKYRYRTEKGEDGRPIKDSNGNNVKIENSEPADLMNTLVKMASKRAFVDATLKATAASRMFTQDMEDFNAMTGQHKGASSKQIGFIKRLFGNKDEKTILAEISQIVGREITKFEDIRSSEASTVIEAKNKNSGGSRNSAPVPAPASAGPFDDPRFPPFEPPTGDPMYDDPMYSDAYEPTSRPTAPAQPRANGAAQIFCVDCGVGITKAEQDYSTNRYGRQLCRKCQAAAQSNRA
jgi:hypothetical protein